MKKIFILILFFSQAMPGAGTCSTVASVDTDIFVHELFQMTDLQIPYMTASQNDILNGSDVVATDGMCVFSNKYMAGSTPQFQIGAASQNGTLSGNPGRFISKNAFFEIEYYVSYSVNGGAYIPFTEGIPSPNISMGSIPNITCQNGLGNNMTLRISLLGSTLASARAGVYSDTLFISIFPPG